MAATFPTSPTNGQTAVVGGVSFVYDSTAGVWNQLQTSTSSPTLTSPTINTSVSGTAIKDEDNMASNSATALATQQSIKSYVDSSSGISNIVEDATPQLGGDLDTNGNDINFGDNEKAQFGASNDLQIFHDTTDSWIQDRGTGNLKLGSNGVGVEIRRKTDSADESMAVFNNNGSVDLYYDNSKKFETTSGGATVTGTLSATAFSGDGSALTGISASASSFTTATSDPASSSPGDVYYNSSTGVLRLRRGDSWSDVNATAPEFTTSSGNLGTIYTTQTKSFTIVVSSSSTPTFSVTSGSLPTGLSLSTSGTNCVISGTLASSHHSDYQSGTSTFTITATTSGLSSSRSFTISTSSRYIGYRCTTASEAGSLSDTAPDGHYFTRVDFSSYGTPNGSCGSFSIGSCNSSSSNNYDPTPTQSYSTSASNGTWGDPCSGVGKRMYIQMSYGPNI